MFIINVIICSVVKTNPQTEFYLIVMKYDMVTVTVYSDQNLYAKLPTKNIFAPRI